MQCIANNINFSKEKRSATKTFRKQGKKFWHEDLDAKELTNRFYRSVPLRMDVTCLGVSRDEQLVAVGYKDGWISIFRLPEFEEVHVFNTMPESKVDHKFILLYDEYRRLEFPENGKNFLPHFGGDYGRVHFLHLAIATDWLLVMVQTK